jgi:DNA-binding PadR family transcriptional regulator
MRNRGGNGKCKKHGREFGPCTCAMGRLPRLVEPTILLLLAEGGRKHGYQLLEEANELVVTDGEIDTGIIYRTLRTLEANGMVTSEWGPGTKGPSRRLYEITDHGRSHLEDWGTVLARLSDRTAELATALKQAAAGRSAK